MALQGQVEPQMLIVPGETIPTQPWWKALHSTIINSFQHKDILAFPPGWTRLKADPKEGAEGLREELGPEGIIVVFFINSHPIACSGALPFRGPNWINDMKSAEDGHTEITTAVKVVVGGEAVTTDPTTTEGERLPQKSGPSTKGDWEICCFCIDPKYRKIGLSLKLLNVLIDHIKTRGAKRLLTNYVIEETGKYWPHVGFETIPGAGGILKKGWTHTKGLEGLRDDIHFAMGVKTI